MVGGRVMVGHPFTNHNSPSGQVVHKIVQMVVSPESLFSTWSTCNVAQYFMTYVLFLALVIRVEVSWKFHSLSFPLKLLNWKKMNQNYSERLVKKKNTILKELF